MILSYMALTCIDMSLYRTTWTHFRTHFTIVQDVFEMFPVKESELFLNCLSLHLAILMICFAYMGYTGSEILES